LSEEGHSESELLDDHVCEHAGREQPAVNQQRRQRRGDNGDALVNLLADRRIVRQQRSVPIRARRLLLGASEHHAHGLGALITEFVAQLPPDEDGTALLELRVSNLDSPLG